MRPKNRNRKVSALEREQIRMFASCGMLQKHIAAQFGLSRATVSKVQKSFGLSPHSTEPLAPEIEKQILDLCRRDYGAPRIASRLGLSQHRVTAVMRAHSFRQRAGKIGCRYFVSREKKRVIRRRFRAFEKRIAREFGVSEEWIQKFWRRRK